MKKVLIIDCGSSKVPEIEKIISELKINFETQKLPEINSINNFDAIIISGAPILLTQTNHQPYLEKAHLIFSDSTKPILGICFGHQLMGLHFGATVSRCNESRTWEEITFSAPFKLTTASKSINYFEDHCECITLPKEFKLIASSKTCTVEAMQHNTNPWFGVQFHPEVSERQGQELIANFIALRSET
jgi:GMP synthase (glutamine-hydrolysing)